MIDPFVFGELFKVRIIDIIDIILFTVLLYEIYNLVKGTAAIRIFIGLIAVYVIWKVVRVFHMELLGEILGQFISVGFIALIVVFQPEIRQFLLLLGDTRIIRRYDRRFLFWRLGFQKPASLSVDTIVKSCKKLSDTGTGALFVITRENELKSYLDTGQMIDAVVSEPLLESIFFKNSPLHDGAVIITGEVIRAARCIMPVSHSPLIPSHAGLRHRAGVGITEKSDALAIIISEERGIISYAMDGVLTEGVSPAGLADLLQQLFSKS